MSSIAWRSGIRGRFPFGCGALDGNSCMLQFSGQQMDLLLNRDRMPMSTLTTPREGRVTVNKSISSAPIVVLGPAAGRHRNRTAIDDRAVRTPPLSLDINYPPFAAESVTDLTSRLLEHNGPGPASLRITAELLWELRYRHCPRLLPPCGEFLVGLGQRRCSVRSRYASSMLICSTSGDV